MVHISNIFLQLMLKNYHRYASLPFHILWNRAQLAWLRNYHVSASWTEVFLANFLHNLLKLHITTKLFYFKYGSLNEAISSSEACAFGHILSAGFSSGSSLLVHKNKTCL